MLVVNTKALPLCHDLPAAIGRQVLSVTQCQPAVAVAVAVAVASVGRVGGGRGVQGRTCGPALRSVTAL